MELVGFRSRHAVSRLVDRLVAEGLVIKDPQGKLIPHAATGAVPLLGMVGLFARRPSCHAHHET
jgi:hypothetical protein